MTKLNLIAFACEATLGTVANANVTMVECTGYVVTLSDTVAVQGEARASSLREFEDLAGSGPPPPFRLGFRLCDSAKPGADFRDDRARSSFSAPNVDVAYITLYVGDDNMISLVAFVNAAPGEPRKGNTNV